MHFPTKVMVTYLNSWLLISTCQEKVQPVRLLALLIYMWLQYWQPSGVKSWKCEFYNQPTWDMVKRTGNVDIDKKKMTSRDTFIPFPLWPKYLKVLVSYREEKTVFEVRFQRDFIPPQWNKHRRGAPHDITESLFTSPERRCYNLQRPTTSDLVSKASPTL